MVLSMNRKDLIVKQSLRLTDEIFELCFEGEFQGIFPGNFISLGLKEQFLRRPFSIADYSESELRVVYRLIGKGTEILSRLKPGDSVDALYPLGNSFTLCDKDEQPLLVAGGLGLTPLFLLLKELIKRSVAPQIAIGLRSAEDAFYIDRIKNEMGIEPIIFTEDGSLGRAGLVTKILGELEFGRIYSCGPEPMLRQIKMLSNVQAEFSLEARMGCAVGACMCCTVKTVSGPKKVCKDGPVFSADELVFPLSGGVS